MFEALAIVAQPFEFNNLLGPLMALGAFAGAVKVLLALGVYRKHLEDQEKQWRKSPLPQRES